MGTCEEDHCGRRATVDLIFSDPNPKFERRFRQMISVCKIHARSYLAKEGWTEVLAPHSNAN